MQQGHFIASADESLMDNTTRAMLLRKATRMMMLIEVLIFMGERKRRSERMNRARRTRQHSHQTLWKDTYPHLSSLQGCGAFREPMEYRCRRTGRHSALLHQPKVASRPLVRQCTVTHPAKFKGCQRLNPSGIDKIRSR